MTRQVRPGAGLLLCALGLGLLATGRVHAQQRSEPQLLLTIFGGAAGGATLYSGLRQPLVLVEDPFAIDTLDLDRRLAPGVTFGASATYFPNPHLGVSGEIVFIGFGLDDTCGMAYTDPSTARRGYNEQICNDIAGKSGSASTIAFYAGGLYRIAPRGGVKPYLRVQAGIATRASSTVEVSGRFVDETGIVRDRLVIADQDPGSAEPSVGFGLGVMLPFAAGYQARLELRDHLLYANRVTGPANALEQAPTERTLINSLGLVFMLDIVLEQRRGRRY